MSRSVFFSFFSRVFKSCLSDSLASSTLLLASLSRFFFFLVLFFVLLSFSSSELPSGPSFSLDLEGAFLVFDFFLSLDLAFVDFLGSSFSILVSSSSRGDLEEEDADGKDASSWRASVSLSSESMREISTETASLGLLGCGTGDFGMTFMVFLSAVILAVYSFCFLINFRNSLSFLALSFPSRSIISASNFSVLANFLRSSLSSFSFACCSSSWGSFSFGARSLVLSEDNVMSTDTVSVPFIPSSDSSSSEPSVISYISM